MRFVPGFGHLLPDVVVDLGGQIHVRLDGRVDSVKGRGDTSALRNSFESAPGAPVSRFVFSLKGGSKGLIQNSGNLCATTPRAKVAFTGQMASSLNPPRKSRWPAARRRARATTATPSITAAPVHKQRNPSVGPSGPPRGSSRGPPPADSAAMPPSADIRQK